MNFNENRCGFGSGEAKLGVARECDARVALSTDTGSWGADMFGARRMRYNIEYR